MEPKVTRLAVAHAIAEALTLATRPDVDAHAIAAKLKRVAAWVEAGAPAKEPRKPRPVEVTAEVHEVFGYWCSAFHKNAATKLTTERAERIAARLADGATVERCKRAIDGCKASPTHNGTKDGAVYNSIDLIFRNMDKLDAFVSMAPKRTGPVAAPPPKPSEPTMTAEQEAEALRKLEEARAKYPNTGALVGAVLGNIGRKIA